MISQVLLLLLRKRSCHYCTVLSIIVCRCSSIDPADSKFCQNQYINTFRAKHQDLMVPLEGGGGYKEMFVFGCCSTNCLVLCDIND